jgi:hypothetical protein
VSNKLPIVQANATPDQRDAANQKILAFLAAHGAADAAERDPGTFGALGAYFVRFGLKLDGSGSPTDISAALLGHLAALGGRIYDEAGSGGAGHVTWPTLGMTFVNGFDPEGLITPGGSSAPSVAPKVVLMLQNELDTAHAQIAADQERFKQDAATIADRDKTIAELKAQLPSSDTGLGPGGIKN